MKLRILIIAPFENRNRFEFLYHPLVALEHEVHVVRNVRELTHRLFVRHFRADIVISIGIGGLSSIAKRIIDKMPGHQPLQLIRFGGDPIGDLSIVIESGVARWKEVLVLKIKRKLRLYEINRYDGIISVSEDLSLRLSRYTPDIVKRFVLPQYVRMKPSSPRLAGDSEDCFDVLCVTNLQYPEKADGVIKLIDVVARVAREYSLLNIPGGVRFVVAGGGRYLKRVKDYASRVEHQTSLRIEVAGFVKNIESLYQKADVFLYSSERDAVPNALLEAKCYGLPIIAFRTPPSEYIVKDLKDGYLVDSEEQAVAMLLNLCNDSDLVYAMGTAGLQDIENRFSFRAIVKRANEFLLELDFESARASAL